MHRRLYSVVLVLLSTGAVCGCALLPIPVEEPRVTPQGVRLEMAGLGGLRGEFDAEIHNPNPVGLPLRRLEYRLRIGGTEAIQGSLELNDTIPAQGSAPVTIGFSVDVVDAIRVSQRLATGERAYTITGTLVFATRLGDLSVAFDHQGELGQ